MLICASLRIFAFCLCIRVGVYACILARCFSFISLHIFICLSPMYPPSPPQERERGCCVSVCDCVFVRGCGYVGWCMDVFVCV